MKEACERITAFCARYYTPTTTKNMSISNVNSVNSFGGETEIMELDTEEIVPNKLGPGVIRTNGCHQPIDNVK